jgi:chromosome partitioning protein
MENTKIIAFAQQKGGSGKTTLAAHLAVVLSLKNYRVALIDITTEATLTRWHGLRTEEKAISCIPTTIWRLQDEIKKLKETTDIIILDTAPHNPMDAHAAIKFSDMVIVPVQPTPLDAWTNQSTLDLIAKERIPHRLIWNRFTTSAALIPYASLQNVLNAQVPNHIDMGNTMAHGLTVIEEEPASMVSHAVLAFSEEILSLLLPQQDLSEEPLAV